MVVAGPRHIIASSALPSNTKPHLTQENRHHHHHQHRTDVTRDSWKPSATTELKQQQQQQQQVVREYHSKNTKSSSTTSLKCPPTAYAFVYGTLKKGFSNYWLMEDVVAKGHARFLGTARTMQKFPMVCGPYQVPFLIDLPAAGHHVHGELYEVDCHAIERLDELEGVTKGNYVRRSIVLSDLQPALEQHGFTSSGEEVVAQAYFAAPSYASRMAEAPHIEAFTEKESATYVSRKDRPQHRTFLQHIDHWIKTQELATTRNSNLSQCSKVS